MATDYRELCIELFGTDDVEKLRVLAGTINEKNNRNAGRKKMFADEEVRKIRTLVADGAKINDIAKMYGTSRQIISKYIHTQPEPEDGYTLRMTYMYKKVPCTVIDVNFLEQRLMVRNETDDILHRAFGAIENPTWTDFETFLKDRCFPPTRGNAEELLEELNLTDYDPLQIVEKTKGRTAEDAMWLKFAYYPRKEPIYAKN